MEVNESGVIVTLTRDDWRDRRRGAPPAAWLAVNTAAKKPPANEFPGLHALLAPRAFGRTRAPPRIGVMRTKLDEIAEAGGAQLAFSVVCSRRYCSVWAKARGGEQGLGTGGGLTVTSESAVMTRQEDSMGRILISAGMLTALCCAGFAQSKERASAGTEQAVMKIERELLNAILKGDASADERYLADTYVFTGPDGTVRTKHKPLRI